jgi:SAM-dependent methyltransferase
MADDDWAAQLEPPDARTGAPSFTPTAAAGSRPYTHRKYWDFRFEREAGCYDWLGTWPSFAHLVERELRRDARILLVGSGNSALPMQMADAGYSRLVASDYSAPVVERMAARTAASHPGIEWRVADMTDLRDVPAGAFDAVIDKAAMDAILADGGDAWEPPSELLATAERVVAETARVLAPGGAYLQLTFAQPHFRRPYLAQRAGRWASLVAHPVPLGLGYVLFVARTPGGAAAAAATPAAAAAAAAVAVCTPDDFGAVAAAGGE